VAHLRRGLIAILTLGLAIAFETSVRADIGGGTTKGGARVMLTKEATQALGREVLESPPQGPKVEFASTAFCGKQPGDAGADDLCPMAVVRCEANSDPEGKGPAVSVFSRLVTLAGEPVPGRDGQWRGRGATCFPQYVPGASKALTMVMIRDAFHDTDFSVPTVNIQPEGDVTLVNLPTFFEVQFPSSGFGPDEVDTPDPARLLGYRIEVRPRLKSITYHLGTTTIGPTTSLGGPYPSGDIRAVYRQPGDQQVRADIVYSGQFRVGGSAWFDIPGTVDLEGTPVTLTVREATSRLYTH